MAALALCSGLGAAEPDVLVADAFDGALQPGWRWLREDAADWCVREGALEIHVQPGNAQTVRNALVRPAPDRRAGRWAVEVTVRNLRPPIQQYEQAGITWYSDGKPVFKLVKERVDGELMIIPGRAPMTAETVRLRLIVTADRYEAQYQPGAEGEWHTAATGELPPPAGDEVSLQCYHGPTESEHWIRFDDFRILRLPD